VALSRKVDDVLGVGWRIGGLNEHGSEMHLVRLACAGVPAVVIRKSLLELQGDSLTHDANAVDRIDQGLDIGL